MTHTLSSFDSPCLSLARNSAASRAAVSMWIRYDIASKAVVPRRASTCPLRVPLSVVSRPLSTRRVLRARLFFALSLLMMQTWVALSSRAWSRLSMAMHSVESQDTISLSHPEPDFPLPLLLPWLPLRVPVPFFSAALATSASIDISAELELNCELNSTLRPHN